MLTYEVSYQLQNQSLVIASQQLEFLSDFLIKHYIFSPSKKVMRQGRFLTFTNPCRSIKILYFSYASSYFYFRSFAKAIGCKITSLKACAKQKTVQEVLDAQSKIFLQLNYLTMAPVVDGYFLPGINFIKLKGKKWLVQMNTGKVLKTSDIQFPSALT